MNKIAVGIDLGTTYSAVAYINELGKPEIITNREGESITPSVVLYQGDQPLVGSMAKRAAATAPDDVVQFVKRSIGDPDWRFVNTQGESFTAEEVSAAIVKRLKDDAELALGQTIHDAVITVPAYFDDARRRATMDAGRIAGLNVLRVINEPTSAALAYGISGADDGTLLVYDLGGGTFDVTIVRVKGGEFDVVGTDGDRNLGGFDWDNELMNWVSEKVLDEHGVDLREDATAQADLRDKVELAKRSLTTISKASILVMVDGRPCTIAVTRDEFEEMTAGLLSRTRRLTEDVLAEAKMQWGDIDRILLVGGSTRMPMVRSMVEEISGRTIDISLNPDEAVALGAAVQGALSSVDDANPSASNESGAGNALALPDGSEISISDVTSQSLGIVALKEARNEEYNSIIIPRNTKIPSQLAGVYHTLAHNQSALRIRVTQGDDEDVDFVTIVGEQVFSIPPYPRGAPMRVTLSYDVDQIIHIEVFDLTANKVIGDFEVDNDANLSRSDVVVASERLSATEVL